jgi:biopolymer transport protein ExbB/TolQ
MQNSLHLVEITLIYILILLGLIVTSLFIYKFKQIQKWKGNATFWHDFALGEWSTRSAQQIQEYLKTQPQAQNFCLSEQLFKSALSNQNWVAEAQEKLLTTQLMRSKRQMEQGVAWIGTIGANAPFVGLTGTVLGILGAFQMMSVQNSAGSPELMAAISRSLIATAAGLGVAIPAVIFYNLLRQKINKVCDEGVDLIRILNAHSLQKSAEHWQATEAKRHQELHHNMTLESQV